MKRSALPAVDVSWEVLSHGEGHPSSIGCGCRSFRVAGVIDWIHGQSIAAWVSFDSECLK
jgi:hypothetical protein